MTSISEFIFCERCGEYEATEVIEIDGEDVPVCKECGRASMEVL